MSDGLLDNPKVPLAVFVLALLLAWVCYQPALTGNFQLDDRSNLEDLQQVSDLDSGLSFVLAGDAGPLGRPIALLTFAAQADSWSQGAGDFIRVNIVIHLFNAILLAFCVFRLSLFLAFERSRAYWNAALVAGLWVLLPLLASASLLVVQRMTTLSATFALLGLGAYLLARERLDSRPMQALTWMSVSLVAGTLLSMLCKESGLLLPVYVLTLELTVLARPVKLSKQFWRGWQLAFLGLPLAVIVVYLVTILPYSESLLLRRGFSGSERLLTEALVLWSYVFKGVLGLPGNLGIFQDAPVVARSLLEPRALIAVLAWLLLLVGAVVWRRRWPLAALAVLWFLAGHLIESTTVALELYFEHRNYLPAIGPLLALCSFVLAQKPAARRAGMAALGLLLLVNASFLYTFASLWGEPSMAARYWALRYPDSVRAVTTLASYQMAEESALRGAQTLSDYVDGHPQHAYLRIQQLNILCRIAGSADHDALVQELHRSLPDAGFTYTAGTMLSELFDASVATDCRSVSPETVKWLATSLRSNALYKGDAQYNQFHYKLLAGIDRYLGDSDAALAHLRTAIDYQPSSELNFMMVTGLVDLGQFAAAREFMDDARAAAPRNPLRAARWNRNLDELSGYVDEVEKYAQ